MKNEEENKTFLFVSSKRLVIVVKDKDKKDLFKKELLIENNLKSLDLDIIKEFINKNIFDIEKKVNHFINNIFLIIDNDNFLSIDLSIKRNMSYEKINIKVVNNLLIDAKEQCKKTLENYDIIHMTIKKYFIDNLSFLLLPKDIVCNNLSLHINFICLPKNYVKDLENILKSYQISLNRIISYNYLVDFLDKDQSDIFILGEKILNGYNQNEVLLVNKTQKNTGIFEKFFNFFN